jgi:hypothetical protein
MHGTTRSLNPIVGQYEASAGSFLACRRTGSRGHQLPLDPADRTAAAQRVLTVAVGWRTHADWHQAAAGADDRGRRECQPYEVQLPWGSREAVRAAPVTASLRLELAVLTYSVEKLPGNLRGLTYVDGNRMTGARRDDGSTRR